MIFFDQGALDNFISEDLAIRLGIKVEELGRALDANQMFHGDPVPVTPLIGMLRLHVHNYVDQENFFVSLLKRHDVVLGIPWFHRHSVQLSFPDRVFQFVHKGIAENSC